MHKQAEDARQEGIIRLTVRNQQRNMHREAAVMRAREARTTFEQPRLKRENDLRDANAAVMIGKIYRGYRTRGEFKKALQAKLELQGFQRKK